MGRIEIGLNGKVLYAVLARHAGNKDHCWPSQKTLARELGVSKRSIQKLTKDLALAGLIEVERGARGDNTYYFLEHEWERGAVRKDAQNSGGSGRSSVNFTLPEVLAAGGQIGMSVAECHHYFEYRDSNGWSKANGRPITDLKDDLRRWEVRGRTYEKGSTKKMFAPGTPADFAHDETAF